MTALVNNILPVSANLSPAPYCAAVLIGRITGLARPSVC